MSRKQQAKIMANRPVARNIWQMSLEQPALAAAVQAGQFVQLRVTGTNDPFLRIPLSVHDGDSEKGTVDFLYQKVGVATGLLTEFKAKQEINVLGPLGRGFKLPSAADGGEAVLVAGGIGVAPLLLLARELKAAAIPTRLFYGAQTQAALARLQAFEQVGVEVNCCTDDGSNGIPGNVMTLLKRHSFAENDEIFACGPAPMLKSLQEFVVGLDLKAQLSLETYMACGFGACLGCAVAKGQGQGYWHVCTDGPVFGEREVAL